MEPDQLLYTLQHVPMFRFALMLLLRSLVLAQNQGHQNFQLHLHMNCIFNGPVNTPFGLRSWLKWWVSSAQGQGVLSLGHINEMFEQHAQGLKICDVTS